MLKHFKLQQNTQLHLTLTWNIKDICYWLVRVDRVNKSPQGPTKDHGLERDFDSWNLTL